MMGNGVARILTAVLGIQLLIAVVLVVGDMRTGGITWPGFTPTAPSLTNPVRPGDQTRRFDPERARPSVAPARDPGTLPDRLTLMPEDGSTWRLEGTIAPGDAERMAGQLSAEGDKIRTLRLQSPGGSVEDALALGRTLRRAGLATELLAGEFCHSACPYLFAGGVTRRVEDGGMLGLHQHYFGENTLLPAFVAVEDIQRGQGDVMVYLDEMGIDPLVMQHALVTPADEIYVLVRGEIERYGFATPR